MLKAKVIVIVTLAVLLSGCGSTSRTANVPVKEDYENEISEKYPKSSEDQLFDKGIAVLAKDLIKVLQRNGKNLYDVSVEEFISGQEYAPGKSETSTFGRILASKIKSEIVQYADVLEREGSDITIEVDVIARKDIKRHDFVTEITKKRVDGSVRVIISGIYHEMNAPMMAIEASVYSSRTAQVEASSTIRVPVPHNLMWQTTSDQYIYKLDNRNWKEE